LKAKPADQLEGKKFKVVVVGDQNVGKTWLINRYMQGGPQQDQLDDTNQSESSSCYAANPNGNEPPKVQQHIKKVRVNRHEQNQMAPRESILEVDDEQSVKTDSDIFMEGGKRTK
jgi:K+-transporting ATPase c subunit